MVKTTWLSPAVVPAAKQVAFLATPSAIPIVAKAADHLIPAAKQVRGRVSGRPGTSPVLRNPGALQGLWGKRTNDSSVPTSAAG